MKKLKLFLGLLAASLVSGNAFAVAINGTINFAGSATLDSSDLTTATQVLSWSNTEATEAITGSFATTVTQGDLATFSAPWVFGSGIDDLWSVGGFTFDLLTSSPFFVNSAILAIEGTGMVSAAGYDDTSGNFIITLQDSNLGGGTEVTFGFSAASTSVPDESSTVALLGLGLAGLGAIARRRK